MSELKTYSNPASYLKATEFFLEELEMQNNVILGNCYNIIRENRSHEDCYFINALDGDRVEASSIKVSPKIILSAASQEGLEEIFRFYNENNIEWKGAIGNKHSVEVFSKLQSAKTLQSRITLIQSLEKVNEIRLAAGKFEPSKLSDLPLLTTWAVKFFEEENLFPRKTKQETELYLKNLMMHGNLFSWIHEGKVVSMAAIIRKTKHTAIIGLVYTPAEFRGKGFGKSCVHQLSEFILKSGYKESGLLVFDPNITAKKIYQQIGYKTVSELLDIDFE